MNSLHEQTHWKKELAPHNKSDIRKSVWQLVNSIVPFVLLWGLSYVSLSISIWLSLVIAIPAAGFLIRIFIIFHDCCHQSFFNRKKANAIIGTITGILTFFPYEQWKNEHSIHHATSGNLCRRGTGDIWILTTEEYSSLSPWKRVGYRLYRNPLILFGLGPVFLYLIEYRLIRNLQTSRTNQHVPYKRSSGCLDRVALLDTGMEGNSDCTGVDSLLVRRCRHMALLRAEHQFEGTYFERGAGWDHLSAALQGSSYYKLPKVLQWMTGNICFHHIHHLDPKCQTTIYRKHMRVSPLGRLFLQFVSSKVCKRFATDFGMKSSKQFVGFRALKR